MKSMSRPMAGSQAHSRVLYRVPHTWVRHRVVAWSCSRGGDSLWFRVPSPRVSPRKVVGAPCADDRMRGVRAKIADVLCLSQSERVTPREQSATLIASALAIASTDSMKLKVLLFAAAKDAAGTPELELELADADSTGISVVVSALQKQYPQLERILPRCALAINGEYVTEDAAPALKAGDEVAVLPPMSGG